MVSVGDANLPLCRVMRQRPNASTVLDKAQIDYPSSLTGDEKKILTSDGSWKRIFYLCLAFRILNSLLVQTYFNPDEHWQLLEVAHQLVFGTLANSLETVLTIASLYYWPCMRVSSGKASPSSRKLALAIAAFACAVRPTSAVIWLYVGLIELFVASDRVKFIFLELPSKAAVNLRLIRAVVLAFASALDRMMYGSWVIVPLNFLKFNFLSSGGDYYGTHPWHWYFTQGFPVMIFTFLPFSVAGVIYSKNWKLCGLIGWVIGIYSVLGHKEFRFVLPVLPIALMFSGYSLAALNTQELPLGKSKRITKVHARWSLKLRLAVFLLLVTNIPMGLYMSLVHQRGTEDVMYYLATEARSGEVRSVLFLTPCHATPYYSVLHQNVPMRFLDCTPSEQTGIPDESDRFMLDPVGFMSEFAKRFFHAHFKVDRDLQSSVVVYVLTSW
ncbi:hypothetical protein Cgig2_017556 [Carnegiea gigantea]|uniref:Mannosyltransferase n=1 Tax=Carnegiea gigantea TaxID=171969 RepID=A0A9Q1QLE5_9CARY|nr:hypothetical protein Cgig2_017556 [Carnegiea gigantea]